MLSRSVAYFFARKPRLNFEVKLLDAARGVGPGASHRCRRDWSPSSRRARRRNTPRRRVDSLRADFMVTSVRKRRPVPDVEEQGPC